MENQEKIVLLNRQIKKLKEELDKNPQYPTQWVESIIDDIQYYQNQIDSLQ